MKKLGFFVGLLLGVVAQPSRAAPAAPDVDTIIARHLAARGGVERLRAITSLMFEHGQYSEPGHESSGDSTMMLMRPYYKLVGYPGRSKELMEGYDGAAWEWYADPGIVLRTTGAASQAARHFADVDGPLLDYRAKGYLAEIAGREVIGGRPSYNVRITMPDGYQADNFIDQKTYMMLASGHTAKVHAFGSDVPSRTTYSDFRPVAGVLFPFKSTEVEIATSKTLNAMQWGSITANRDIPVAWFSPPVFERTQIQTFIEQLFWQREDPSAVMWTYRLYRRAHPDEDTSDAAQVAGYQAVKMEQTASAIELLQQNAKDYPNKANAAFGLGRAYAAAGRRADAKLQFQRALQLQPDHNRASDALKDLDTPKANPQ